MSTPAVNFSEREFVIVQVSRLLEAKCIYWVGGGGEPLASVLLAKRTRVPELQYLTEDGVVAPEALVPFDPLMTMVASRANYRALQWGTMNYAADIAHLGYVDYGILNTLQVDRYGNINSTVVGKYEGGEGRRFGGPGGADSIAALAWRTILITDQHKRKFVEKVDFISSPGFVDGPGARQKRGLAAGGGPWRVYSPWAMFGYGQDCQLMLQAVAPYVTVDQVLDEMSFKPKMAKKIAPLEPPTEEELLILRTQIDVGGQVTDRGRWIELKDGKYRFAE
jgi:glutaconate CoA-transferase subunit B